jgi:hypothetical protein
MIKRILFRKHKHDLKGAGNSAFFVREILMVSLRHVLLASHQSECGQACYTIQSFFEYQQTENKPTKTIIYS